MQRNRLHLRVCGVTAVVWLEMGDWAAERNWREAFAKEALVDCGCER